MKTRQSRELSSCEAVRVKPVARKNPQAHFVVIIIVRIGLYMYSMLRVKENDIFIPFRRGRFADYFYETKTWAKKSPENDDETYFFPGGL